MMENAEFQKAWGEWADKTFPNSTLDTIASHFREEAFEFAGGDKPIDDHVYEHTPPSHDPVEAADCLLLMLHHAHKAGYSLFDEALKKAKINQARTWDTTDEGGHGHFKHTEVTTPQSRWAKRNRGRQNHYKAWWKAKRDSYLAPWAEQEREAIMALYIEAHKAGMHVDHIVPTRDSDVCGLHCLTNLRLLPSYENVLRSRKTWEELNPDNPVPF